MHPTFCARFFLLNARPKFLGSFAVCRLTRGLAYLSGKIKPKSHSSNDSKCSITVVGTGGNGIYPALYIECCDKAYMFNCGEGTFRDINKLDKNPVFFATRGSWENIGGLVELFYAVSLGSLNGDRKSITCSVPSNVDHMFSESLCRITGRNTWHLHKDRTHFQDDSITIRGTEIKLPGSQDYVVAYSCKLHKIGHKFNFSNSFSKIDQQGSPEYNTEHENHINRSKSIDSSEGKSDKSEKGCTFMVIECPDKSFASEICGRPHLNSQWFLDNGEVVDLVIHITPLEVLQLDDYCRWMARFGEKVHHVLLHSSVCSSEILDRKAMLLSKAFNLLNPRVYLKPYVPNKKAANFSEMNIKNHLPINQVTIGKTQLKFDLYTDRPLFIDNSTTLKPFDEWFQNSFHKVRTVCDTNFENYHKLVGMKTDNIPNNVVSTRESLLALDDINDFAVTFLGTASKMSSPFRNTTAILVETLTDGNLLLDCGEATLKQLYSCFGKDRARTILSNTQNIFISHLHPDHFIGLFSVLSDIFEANGNTRINIIGPATLELHLRLYCKCYPELDYNFLNSKMGLLDPFMHGNLCLKTIPVEHVRESYGIKISNGKNKSIVYSGDTQPCSKLIVEGRNTDLLIHEATTLDYHKSTSHSTYSQAVEVSREMKASFTILTHFAAYNTLRVLNQHLHPRVIPAVDFMSFRLSDIRDQNLDSIQSHYALKAIAKSMQL